MSAVKWSQKGAKASPVGQDEFLILDSADTNDATKNKRVSISNLFKDNVGLLNSQGKILTHNATAITTISTPPNNGQVLTETL